LVELANTRAAPLMLYNYCTQWRNNITLNREHTASDRQGGGKYIHY